jgi:hypothetical protein
VVPRTDGAQFRKERLGPCEASVPDDTAEPQPDAKPLLPVFSSEEMNFIRDVKIDNVNYPGSILYFRDDKFMFEIENDRVFLNYHLFWKIFEDEFNMNYVQIQDFIKSALGKHFKMKGVAAFFI